MMLHATNLISKLVMKQYMLEIQHLVQKAANY